MTQLSSDYVFVVVTDDGEEYYHTEEFDSKLRAIKHAMDFIAANPDNGTVGVTAKYVAGTKFIEIRDKFFSELAKSGLSEVTIKDYLGEDQYRAYTGYLAAKQSPVRINWEA